MTSGTDEALCITDVRGSKVLRVQKMEDRKIGVWIGEVLQPKTERIRVALTKDGENWRESEQDGSAETKDGENRRELERSGTELSCDSDKHFMGFSEAGR